MKNHSIATVINFCTNESRFIKSCIEQALIFSAQVIVPVSTHFFDGTEENKALLQEIYTAFPECQFVEYPFVPKKIPSLIFKTVGADHFWHCASRLVGAAFLEAEVDMVLFLDADEIADGLRVQEWLDSSDYRQHTVLKMANYWYFREPCYRAKTLEDSIVLVQKKIITVDLLLNFDERCALYNLLPHPKRKMVVGADGLPLFHHFSWVRTEEEMRKKVKSWGHKNDRSWDQLITEEFSAPFQGADFVHGYQFCQVPPPFVISLEAPQFVAKGVKNLCRLSEAEFEALVSLKKTSWWHLFVGRFKRGLFHQTR